MMLDSLPPGWMSTELKAVAEIRLGRQRSPSRAFGPNMRKYVRAANVKWTGISLADVKEMDFDDEEMARFRLQDGDLLVVEGSGSKGEVGKTAVWAGDLQDCCFQNTLIRVRAPRHLVPFLHRHLDADARLGNFARLSRGVGILHIGSKRLEKWPTVLPPLNEQRRIVAKIDALQARTRRAREALDSIPALLDRFRQSVLAAAFRGDLTADWRAQNPDVEPASELLERIRAERKVRWIEAAAEKARARAEAKAIKAGKPWGPADDEKVLARERVKAEKKYKAPEPVDAEGEGLPELPEGWCWCRIDEVTEFVTSGSRGWGKYYAASGALFLRVGNLDRNTIELDLAKLAYVRAPAGAEGTRTKVRQGDVLLSITADVGMVGVVPEALGDAFINQHVALLRPIAGLASKPFAYSLCDPEGLQKVVRDVQYGVTKASLSLLQVRDFAVPLPPAAEAERIGLALDRCLTRVGEQEQLIGTARARVDTLDQAILAKAFRGELVPQDPNDEPASELLERIKAERQAAAASKPKRRRGRPRKGA